jgi:SOS-response transcriptional repressor LexA
VCGAVFLVTSAFAVEWQKESALFEFPGSAVKKVNNVSRSCILANARLCGKNQVVFRYSLPSNVAAIIEVYSVNGVRLVSIPVTGRTTTAAWKSPTKHASGIYTAIMKTTDMQKSIRFVIAN